MEVVATKLKIHMIALGVSDLLRSLAFYKDGLGFEAHYNSGEQIAFLKTDHIAIELFLNKVLHTTSTTTIKARATENMGKMLLAHNVMTSHEVDSLLALAEQAGGHILIPGRKTAWGGYHGYFCDPDGYCWVVTYWDQWGKILDGSLIL